MSYSFRTARTVEDFEAVRRLNHDVFALEIGQHPAAADGRLIDAFEPASSFVLALHGRRVVGMVSWHRTPPWSVGKKLADPAVVDALPAPLCEARLLAVLPEHRGKPVLVGLLATLFDAVAAAQARTVLISAYEERLDMYRAMGFEPLGPAVAAGAARFIPMALVLDRMPAFARRALARYASRAGS